MNKVLKEDIEKFVEDFDLKDEFKGATMLVTGATGLIGSTFVHCLISLNKKNRIIAPVRNINKATEIFSDDELSRISLIEYNSFHKELNNIDYIHYIVHCASPTSGLFFSENPVETFTFAYELTKSLLEYSRIHSVKGMLFASSIEYYGQVLDEKEITEDFVGYIDPCSTRSSYPMGKRAAEYLCFAYAREYNVPVKIARLTQTFGSGVQQTDNRVFAQFARNVIRNEDIELHTDGLSSKPYCYTTDVVSAFLYILSKGENGEAYNVANKETYISIKDFALFFKLNFSKGINIVINKDKDKGYAPTTKLKLSTMKLEKLGWSPKYNLLKMCEQLIKCMK